MHDEIKKVVDSAVDFAMSMESNLVETEHMLYGILCNETSAAAKVLRDFGVNKKTYTKVVLSLRKKTGSSGNVSLSKNVSIILSKTNDAKANLQDVLYLLLTTKQFKSYIIVSSVFGIDVETILNKLKPSLGVFSENKKTQTSLNLTDNLPEDLKNLGINLNIKMEKSDIDKIIGRDEETDRMIEILCRKTKNNPVLIGEPGVGKSSVVEGLALRISRGEVPDLLLGKIIFSLDLASLMAGTKFRGSMEEKLKKAIDAILADPRIIVFIDEIHMLGQAGKENDISPSDILKPYLARGEIRCIGATTPKEYKDYIEKDSALERRFQPISVEEPSENDTISIIKNLRPSFEKFHNVSISDDAIESAVLLSTRYITNRFLPDKAIDLIDEACSKIKLASTPASSEILELNKQVALLDKQKAECLISGREDYLRANEINLKKAQILDKINQIKQNYTKNGKFLLEITQDDIRNVVSSWTKIPVNKLTSTEKEKLLNLEKIISSRVIGQDEAVAAVASAIRRSKADINDPNKPIGSFMFLGPTGVGKTELSKAIADIVFDDENSIVRFDMSEFMEQSSVSRLIGAPPGYVGYDAGGELTDAVKKNPYSVVLFDEIEKAHNDIFNLLLQILDEGRLTDSKGKLINFKNTIVILTSNNGVQDLLRKKKYDRENGILSNVSDEDFLTNKLRERFKPELLNRIDQIVIFNSLSKESVLKISSLMLDSFVKRVAKKNIKVIITDDAKNLVCEKGYDEEFGARPIKKVIDKQIKDVLANMIISGELCENSVVKIDAKQSEFTFNIIC